MKQTAFLRVKYVSFLYPGPKRCARKREGFKLGRYRSIQLRLLDVSIFPGIRNADIYLA